MGQRRYWPRVENAPRTVLSCLWYLCPCMNTWGYAGNRSLCTKEWLSSWSISWAWLCTTASHEKVTGSGAPSSLLSSALETMPLSSVFRN